MASLRKVLAGIPMAFSEFFSDDEKEEGGVVAAAVEEQGAATQESATSREGEAPFLDNAKRKAASPQGMRLRQRVDTRL